MFFIDHDQRGHPLRFVFNIYACLFKRKFKFQTAYNVQALFLKAKPTSTRDQVPSLRQHRCKDFEDLCGRAGKQCSGYFRRTQSYVYEQAQLSIQHGASFEISATFTSTLVSLTKTVHKTLASLSKRLLLLTVLYYCNHMCHSFRIVDLARFDHSFFSTSSAEAFQVSPNFQLLFLKLWKMPICPFQRSNAEIWVLRCCY